MNKKIISIKETAKILRVSLDTLRRWDKAGKLRSIRATPTSHRCYNLDDIELLCKNIFSLAQNWALSKNPIELEKKFYCPDVIQFQTKLTKFENKLKEIPSFKENYSLLTAITGEIGNNSFDHNIGSWTDIRGIFFAYDVDKKQVALADRGQGILKTLKRVRPDLKNDQEALRVAFTEKISGRSPESRGNGLKFVKKIITQKNAGLNIKLHFQSGDAALNLETGNANLKILKTEMNILGCLALISF